MEYIASQIEAIRNQLPDHVQLIAVSKTHPTEKIQVAYDAGQRHFGENKVQEFTAKAPELPDDICWHLIGHLQTNKVKYIVDRVHLIHSVDSFKLLKEINKRAAKINRVVDVLLQMHIADEETKFGLDQQELSDILASDEFASMAAVRVRGLMGMATFTDDQDQVKREFASLKTLFDKVKLNHTGNDRWQPEVLSMGMSGDWKMAVDEGSTMIRVGSAIFGQRDYGTN